MNSSIKLPFYVKWSILLVGFFFFISMLSIAQAIILPVIYATILAILLSPVVNYMERKKINRTISIAAVLSLAFLMIICLVFLVISQTSLLIDAWPQLSARFQEVLQGFVTWASDYFNISVRNINKWVASGKVDFLNSGNFEIGNTITTVGSVLATVFLTPVYIFMILYYQPHLIRFTHQLFGSDNDSEVSEILGQTKGIVQNYLVGLFTEFVIIAILNSVGLLFLGIQYAILLGIIGALLNVIPYLGGLIAIGVYMAIALVTKAPIYVFYVMSLYLFIQFIDNNYIIHKVVGAKVKLNALMSILAVIAGAALWGIPGMFLSIPLMAIVKLIADRIDPLKPWGFLLGDTMPPIIKLKGKLRSKA